MVLKLSDISTKEWARADKWDVRFRTGQGPSEYTNWLPATEVNAPIVAMSTYDFSSGHMMFAMPKAKSVPDLTMTVYDDDKRSMKKFFRAWADEIFSNDNGLKYMSDIVKVLDIATLNLQNEVVETESYVVFLSGSLASVYASTDGPVSYSLTFKVVGYAVS